MQKAIALMGVLTAVTVLLGCASPPATPTQQPPVGSTATARAAGAAAATQSPAMAATSSPTLLPTLTATPTAVATFTPTQAPQPTSTPTRTATPRPTVTPVQPTATPKVTGTTKAAEVAPSLEGKVKGTFIYYIDGGWLYVKVGISNLDTTRTITKWTMEYWLTSEKREPYNFSTWTTPNITVSPGTSMPPAVEGKWNLADWNKEKLGQSYPEGLAQEVLSNRSGWGVQVKITSVVYQ